jgi:hypothetical protein
VIKVNEGVGLKIRQIIQVWILQIIRSVKLPKIDERTPNLRMFVYIATTITKGNLKLHCISLGPPLPNQPIDGDVLESIKQSSLPHFWYKEHFISRAVTFRKPKIRGISFQIPECSEKRGKSEQCFSTRFSIDRQNGRVMASIRRWGYGWFCGKAASLTDPCRRSGLLLDEKDSGPRKCKDHISRRISYGSAGNKVKLVICGKGTNWIL